ncbi:PASTA domain-containing protein [Dysgonomonas sp. ZJ279]|uniref:PASTA domain-containing protein n=1 Tax=Dysgonomonas sp. ZJ279 TaxID=2709796 RepID=UPI0013ED8B44|nr:PASTA domain-containing protein [Dysgonomonas sp. ZJ279]
MEKKKSILLKILSNVYVKNLLLMALVLVVLITIILVALSYYTKHNETIAVPTIKGLQVDEAASILRASDLKYEIIDSVFLAGGVPGAIIDQVPKEMANVKRGRTVFLIVQAKSVQMVAIPELRDYSQRQAEAQLNSLGFNNIIIDHVPSAYVGLVMSLSYKGQQLTAGQKIPKGSTLRMAVGGGGEDTGVDSLEQENPATNNNTIEKSFFK